MSKILKYHQKNIKYIYENIQITAFINCIINNSFNNSFINKIIEEFLEIFF